MSASRLRVFLTDAFVALYPYLNKVVRAGGLGRSCEKSPRSDVTLFAPKARPVVRKD
jgi:hypothetical protein